MGIPHGMLGMTCMLCKGHIYAVLMSSGRCRNVSLERADTRQRQLSMQPTTLNVSCWAGPGVLFRGSPWHLQHGIARFQQSRRAALLPRRTADLVEELRSLRARHPRGERKQRQLLGQRKALAQHAARVGAHISLHVAGKRLCLSYR